MQYVRTAENVGSPGAEDYSQMMKAPRIEDNSRFISKLCNILQKPGIIFGPRVSDLRLS
jgi:hypothetical protein